VSYGTNIYVVDLSTLRRAFGSHDQAIVDRISAANQDRFVRSDRWFKDRIAQGAPRLQQALQQLIDGNLDSAASAAFQYGYALELLCRELGRDMKTYEDIDSINDLLVQSEFARVGPPLPIPISLDFPEIRYASREDVIAEKRSLLAKEDLESDPCIVQARNTLLGCLDTAIELHQSLVAFRY
jgi:hypothetical protein